MPTIAAGLAGLTLTGAATILGADQVQSSGPDLQGIALLVTAISGLVATIGALVIALKRKPGTESDASLALRIAAHSLGIDEETPDAPP